MMRRFGQGNKRGPAFQEARDGLGCAHPFDCRFAKATQNVQVSAPTLDCGSEKEMLTYEKNLDMEQGVLSVKSIRLSPAARKLRRGNSGNAQRTRT